MAKYVIDMPQEGKTGFANNDWNIPLVLSNALNNATPLEEVLEDIKGEIEQEKVNTSNLHYDDLEQAESFNCGIANALYIIDNHINKDI